MFVCSTPATETKRNERKKIICVKKPLTTTSTTHAHVAGEPGGIVSNADEGGLYLLNSQRRFSAMPPPTPKHRVVRRRLSQQYNPSSIGGMVHRRLPRLPQNITPDDHRQLLTLFHELRRNELDHASLSSSQHVRSHSPSQDLPILLSSGEPYVVVVVVCLWFVFIVFRTFH